MLLSQECADIIVWLLLSVSTCTAMCLSVINFLVTVICLDMRKLLLICAVLIYKLVLLLLLRIASVLVEWLL